MASDEGPRPVYKKNGFLASYASSSWCMSLRGVKTEVSGNTRVT